MSCEIIEVNTDGMPVPAVGVDLFGNRSAVSDIIQSQAGHEVTIIVQGYNRLEKTRRSVESVLENTGGIDYELVLIDNGSGDGTLEYFKSVSYPAKKIYHITNNAGAAFPMFKLSIASLGKFVCPLPNDIIVTPRWMENLLICMKSDMRIGMVNPLSSNTSNLQCVDVEYSGYADLQSKAARINLSDPCKWEDRQRLITLGTVYRKEALLAIGWPFSDVGFFHDFGDDDTAFRIRRAGYRTVLAGDTWICHDHDYRHGEDKDPDEFNKSLKIGRRNFREKYFGVDAWDDVNNYYIPYLPRFPKPNSKMTRASILGVDTRCGTPILDIKNWLRKFGIFDTELSAFTQNPKYWLDLKTICSGPVICDREEYLRDSFLPESFDYVLADVPINRCHEPEKMLRDLFGLCRKDGFVICKLKNAYSFREFLNLLGQTDVYNSEISYNISPERFEKALKIHGEIAISLRINEGLSKGDKELLASLLPGELLQSQKDAALARMVCSEYLYVVRKRT